MNKKIRRMGKSVRMKTSKHAPELLLGLGIGGMITSTILAVKATPKACQIIEEEKKALETDVLTAVDTVKLTWRHYMPAVLVGGVSVVCLLWGNRVSIKRYTALAAACSLSDTALRDYRKKVIEKLGEQKDAEIRKEITKDKMENSPVSRHIVEGTGLGNELCFDVLSGRYFMSDVHRLQKAENVLNRRMREECWLTGNEYFDEIGMDAIPLGDGVGWNIDRGYIQFEFDSRLTDDNRPCIVVYHKNPPQYEYK